MGRKPDPQRRPDFREQHEKAVDEGREAYHRGDAATSCPHSDALRASWMFGWREEHGAVQR